MLQRENWNYIEFLGRDNVAMGNFGEKYCVLTIVIHMDKSFKRGTVSITKNELKSQISILTR